VRKSQQEMTSRERVTATDENIRIIFDTVKEIQEGMHDTKGPV